MKKYLKEMIPAFILSFVTGFMIFLYEPITVFASNTEDFWFDIRILLKANLIFLITLVVGILIFSTLVYFISKKLKKEFIYGVYLLIFFVCFVFTYIQGNYLSGMLPTLDGTPILWDQYSTQGIISCVLLIVLLVLNIILFIKLKEKYSKLITYIPIVVMIMLLASFITTLCTNNQIYKQKGTYIATNKKINNLSTNENFLVLLVDMVDSKTFDKILKENNKEQVFKDFTYFPDTLSAYPFTRESIPFIFSGKWYEAQTDFADYYNEAFNNSQLISTLKDNKFDVNIYEQDLPWTDSKSGEIDNIEIINSEIDIILFLKQEMKYILFKYLPFPLKQYSKIETLDYRLCREDNEDTSKIFNSDNKKTYDVLTNVSLQKDKYFQFLHVEGGHYPWNTNKDFAIIENGTYEEKIESSLTLIEKYLNRIKESGQYDKSVIIVLSDHGNNGYDPVGRQNPILYIKGINEIHDEMLISNKKVSYVDLNDSIYSDLLIGKKSSELLKNIDDNRVRRFIWYKDYDDMYEQTLDGNAWETDKLINTGNRYKR